jgi:magnesium-transporting ATPase (P-type)
MYQGLNVPQLKFIVSYIKEDCKKTVAYLGRELSHLSLISEADVGFAELLTVTEKGARKGISVSDKSIPISAVNAKDTARGGCEALKFSADVAISKADAEGNGGFNSAVLSVISAKGIWRNLYLMFEYLTLTFASRLVLVLFSMISGVSLLTPIQLLFMGVICDLTAIMMIAFEKPEKTILKRRTAAKNKASIKAGKTKFLKQRSLKQLSIYALISAVGTLAIIGTMFLAKKLTGSGIEGLPTVAFIGSIAFQLSLIAEITNEGSIFKSKIKIYNIYPFYIAVIAAIISLSMIFPVMGNAMSIVVLKGYEWIEVFIPAVLIISIFEIFKIFQKNLKKAK